MKKRSKRILILVALLCFVFSGLAPGFAMDDSTRVLMKAPQSDAAFVAEFKGIGNISTESFVRKYQLQEGLVIRQSRIENGKIIIPPSGLYYTSRAPLAKILQGDKVVILGKVYTLVDNGTRLDVIKNADVLKGGSAPLGDGTKHLELSSISLDGNGFISPRATFQILKPSGNYYGASFAGSTDSKIHNITSGVLNNATSKIAGSYLPGEDGQNWHIEYYDSNVATSGQSYLVLDEVTATGAKIKEFGTGAINWMLLTEKAPKELLLGVGERAHVKDWVIKVEAITATSATVKLWNTKTKETIIKELGPLTEETAKYLPADEINRNKLVVRPPANDIQVQLDAFRGAFKDGKVALVAYYDILKINNPGLWPSDDRFIARPDT